MTALEWLDAVRADLRRATPGPWEAGSFPDAPWDPAHSFVEIGEHEVRLDWLDGSALDALLIARAPDRLDRMERALRSVMEAHDWTVHCGNVRHTRMDAMCDQCEAVCAACGEDYPCPTVATIQEALSDE